MNLKSLNILTIAVVLFFASSSILNGQHNHGSHGHNNSNNSMHITAPHGGEVQEAGKYSIEMVVNMALKNDKISIYLLNGKGKTMSITKVSGQIKMTSNSGKITEQNLDTRGDNQFVAQLDNYDSFTSQVTLRVKGKMIHANFANEGLAVPNIFASYTCPMHSEVVKNERGKCPKCGMELELKK